MKQLVASFLFFGLHVSFSFAQTGTVIHQTFQVDSINELTLDLYQNDYQLEFWAGNTILTETKVKLYNAPEHVLEFFVEEQQRYKINDTLMTEKALHLVSNNKVRKPFEYRGTSCSEIVEVRLFIPDVFQMIEENTYTRNE